MQKTIGLIVCLFIFCSSAGYAKEEASKLSTDIASQLQSKFMEPKVIDQKKFNDLLVVRLSVKAADHNEAFVIITPQSKVIDIDDYAILSGINIKKDPQFKTLAQRYPNIDSLWPGNHQYPESVNLPGGITQLQFTYSLLNGCHACDLAGIAKVGFNFDAKGSFLGAQLLGLSPPPVANT